MPTLKLLKQAVLGLSKLFCQLPESQGRVLATGCGLAAWLSWRSERLRLEDCLSRVYFRMNRPMPEPVSDIVRKAFVHFSLVGYELLMFPRLNKASLAEKVTLHHRGNIEKALQGGRGVIMTLPHIGNWEILGAALAHAGYPLHSFYLAQKEDEIGGLLDHFRGYSGITLYDRDRGGIKALKALRSGNILGMIADQDGANNGVYMNFLGHWISMPAGPANWSLKTGARLMPLYALRQGNSLHYNGVLLPPIDEKEEGTHSQQVIARTVKLARWMEELILSHPHQYLWFYDRFKPRHEAWITAEKMKGGQMWHGTARYGN